MNGRGPILTLSEAVRLKQPCVYGLCDNAGSVFYVGQTKRPWRRFREHSRGSKNPLLAARLSRGFRVVLLAENPSDLNAVEREFIGSFEGLLNAVGPDHWSWTHRHDRPWFAGTGVAYPSQVALGFCSAKTARAVKRAIRRMGVVDRCLFEIEVFRDLPLLTRRRLEKWLGMVEHKMLACFEKHSKTINA